MTLWLLFCLAAAQDTDEPLDAIEERVGDLEEAVDRRGEEVAELQELTTALLAALHIEDQGPPLPDDIEDDPVDAEEVPVPAPSPAPRDTNVPLASPLSIEDHD